MLPTVVKSLVLWPKSLLIDQNVRSEAGQRTRQVEKRDRKRNLVRATARRVNAATTRAKASAKTAITASLPVTVGLVLPKSPCPRLLLCNKPPTDSEAALILEAIQAAQAEAKRWSEILKTGKDSGVTSRAWERAIIHKINKATQFVHQHQAVISIVRRLPVEILQEVFLWVAAIPYPRDPSLPLTLVYWDSEYIWYLGQICQPWRTIALNLPGLWGIPPIFISRRPEKTRLQVKYISELLRRSKGGMLHFMIKAFTIDSDGLKTHPVIDLLCEHAEKWEAVSMTLSPEMFANLSCIRGRLPVLKTLQLLTYKGEGDAQLPMQLNNCFEAAPLLTSAFVDDHIQRMFALPFKQLLHYHEHVYVGLSISSTIDRCALVTFSCASRDLDFVFPKITLPRLTSFHVHLHGSLNSQHCFDNLTLPAVQDMKIIAKAENTLPSVRRMLTKSSPHCLQELTIRFPQSVPANELSELLLLTPDLDVLDTTMPSNDDIVNLSIGYEGRVLVPLLHLCELRLHAEDKVSDTMITSLKALAYCRGEDSKYITRHNLTTKCEVVDAPEMCVVGIHFSFGEVDDLVQIHSRLEDWSPESTPSKQLASLKDRLYKLVPSLHPRTIFRYNITRDGSTVLMDRILKEIHYVQVKDVREIVVSY
ncbi:hypothetical protein JR316_0001781 [Psilocybe cubensis]|uniref:Uncharacterized protein n=1 Tax=Psilocybe cubensis TaxID=181762 RepID=A0ACB8HCF2_PSICU|nr:hypothetical protein JR316_0001781 [Psilocybe cubensis]KAH9484879.1 hypothetical protein JR316_0001781 [Psilocybe cubensis]